jgi:hypothetical protein
MKEKKSAGAKSKEQSGWLLSTTPCLARNIFTTSAEWEGPLSWNNNQPPSDGNYGLTWEMDFNNLPITST